jgi:hypothetical protein
LCGSANGEAKISELVLNDDTITQSRGMITSSDQATRMVCDTPPMTLSPVDVVRFRPSVASTPGESDVVPDDATSR